MASLLDALKKAKLVDPKQAEQVEAQKSRLLKREEQFSEDRASYRADMDEEETERQEQFLRRAARETTQPASRVGTKAYYDRFKK